MAGIIGNLLGGVIVDMFDVRLFYTMAAFMMLSAVVGYYIWLRVYGDKYPAVNASDTPG